jgi:hypothetical protein
MNQNSFGVREYESELGAKTLFHANDFSKTAFYGAILGVDVF